MTVSDTEAIAISRNKGSELPPLHHDYGIKALTTVIMALKQVSVAEKTLTRSCSERQDEGSAVEKPWPFVGSVSPIAVPRHGSFAFSPQMGYLLIGIFIIRFPSACLTHMTLLLIPVDHNGPCAHSRFPFVRLVWLAMVPHWGLPFRFILMLDFCFLSLQSFLLPRHQYYCL